MVFNTLTQNKVEFVPKDGNTVKWYICGPTVYDSSHLGHARTYVAFDVIRRILSDYFGYDIFCVMNVTDIDDKIILRARRNHLLKLYRDAKPSIDKVISDAKTELEKALTKHDGKAAALEKEVGQEQSSANKKAMQAELDTLAFKRTALVAYQATLEAAAGWTDAGALIDSVGDLIANGLDAEKGSEVTDQQIFRDHAAFYENEYLEDMATLGVNLPDVLTRVTEFVPQVVDYIQKIMDNGFAYEAQGSVYFDIRKYQSSHSYRKLSFSAAAIKAAFDEGEGALASCDGKRCEFDFALWKCSKAGEPCWDSPWGQGRPGWHIECSVMASDLLGDTLDIHGGGIDLCFPHHDNELAQAEAYYGHQQWVNYFLHSGHLNIGFQKMSKSLKNFFTIREIFKGGSVMRVSEDETVVLPPYTPRQLRLLFMMYQWDEPMFFAKDTLDVACGKEKTFKDFFGSVQAMSRDHMPNLVSKPQGWSDVERQLYRKVEECQGEVHNALCDNFNTPVVLSKLGELVSACNIYMNDASLPHKQFLLVHKAAVYITRIFRLLGIDDANGSYAFTTRAGGDAEHLPSALDSFCSFREQVRAGCRSKMSSDDIRAMADKARSETLASLRGKAEGQKQVTVDQVLDAFDKWAASVAEAAARGDPRQAYLQLCDQVRDSVLPELGVRLEDQGEGFVWKLDDPEVLRREREEKAKAASEAQRKKVENKLAQAQANLDKALASSTPPAEVFRGQSDKWSKFDEGGIPTHNAAGEELNKSARKNAEKEFKRREADHKKYTDQVAKNANYMADLESEVKQMAQQLAAL